MSASATPLSPAADQLVRATLERVMSEADVLFADLHTAVQGSAPAGLVEDPALATEIERSNVAILGAWLLATARQPGVAIDPVLTAETINIVRDVARRGLEDSTDTYFRVGLAVASQHVLRAAFALSTDPEVLQEALEVMLGSSADYIDRSVAALREIVERERNTRAARGHELRLQIATAVLDGEELPTETVSARLGYEIGQPLLGCILWADPTAGATMASFEELARRLADAIGARPPLVIAASAASAWMWLPCREHPPIDALRTAAVESDHVRVAVGSVGDGTAGFRRGHHDAASTQRLMHRFGGAVQLATHEELRIAALAGSDEVAADEFIGVVLGPLATAPPELRSTLRAVLATRFDTGQVATQLAVHRNTVLSRVRRAEGLLPRADPARWIHVAVALELDHWRNGPPA